MKKLVCIAVLLLFTVTALPIGTSFATQTDATAEPVQESGITQETNATPFDFSKPIRVGYYNAFDDMIVDIDSLNNKGYGYEVFQKISERSGLQFEFVPIADSMIEAVKSGYVDVGGFNTRSDERRQQVLFSENPYTKTYLALMTKDMDVRYSDTAAIDGKTVAVYDENMGFENLNAFCENNNISVEYVYGETDKYMELDTDFYITYSEDPKARELNNVLNLGVFNLYLISSFENAELMQEIDKHFLDVIHTEGNFFMELEEKYLSEHIEMSHRGLTTQEVEKLQQRPLEVGYAVGFSPLTYTNEQGNPDGALVDVLNNFAQLYNFEVNYHPYNIEDPQQEYSNYDLLLTLYGDGEQEYEYYAPTEPFYQMPMYGIVNNERIDTTVRSDIVAEGSKIGSLPYQGLDFSAFLTAAPSAEFVFYNSWDELLEALGIGAVDMIICTESATTYAQLYFDDNEITTIPTDAAVPLQFFINKNIANEYIPLFNVMSDRFSSLEYEAIIETNSNEGIPRSEMSFWDLIVDNWQVFAMGIILIFAAFGALYFWGLIAKKEALLQSYNTDKLTGLMAVQKFGETVDETLANAKPGEYEMIAFDIDVFKTINTHFNRHTGDEIIVEIAQTLKNSFKNTSAILSRRIADQFLIFRKVDDGGTMRSIYINEILPIIREHLNDKYYVTMSFGDVVINNVDDSSSTVIGQADTARLCGKNKYKTTFVSFDEKMRKHYDDKINITFRMEQALRDKEFFVEYQPKINFNTMKVGGAEALVRWSPKMGERIYPDEFIPIFEKNGFISNIDLFVLDEVCKCISENCNKMIIPRISVNLSSHTVLSDNIINRVQDIVTTNNVNPDMIELELTESAIEENTEEFLKRVKQFKKLGFSISIDDFGAGVSSLNRLSAIEADVLKLDKAFFNLKEQGANSTIVVADVISMAKHLKMRVVAEGVETFAQALWLKKIGCDYAQGYYFAKPMNKDDFKNLLISEYEYCINL